MSWAGISSNQTVSRNNLQNAVNTGVFVLKNSIPATNECITKTEAEDYVYINPIPSKTSNQLVVKSNLIAASPLPYSYTLYFDYSDVNVYVGFTTIGGACSATNAVTVYSNSSSIGVGTALYSDLYGTEPLLATVISQIYFRIGSNYITFQPSSVGQGDGYIINSIGSCGGSLATILIGTNNSLDIALNLFNITVNGVNVTNISGVDPNTPGNGGSVQTNQIGTYNITFTYSCSIPGQHIELIDSAFNYQCNNASTGFNSMTFYGVAINTSVDLLLTCYDGTC